LLQTDGATYTFSTDVESSVYIRNGRNGMFNSFSSKKKIKLLGDPNKIVEYTNGLEEEIGRLKKEIDSLRISLDNKTAEIQYLEAMNRSKW
jgi:SMC interacting uncharacterized protein involved in chromosome segregation